MQNENSYLIHAEPLAPAKPALGQPCNGCGICCLAEPCPLGILLFRKRTGACPALRWDSAANHYRCGALVDARATASQAMPSALQGLVPSVALLLRHGAARWIASGSGCDSSLEPVPYPAIPQDRPPDSTNIHHHQNPHHD